MVKDWDQHVLEAEELARTAGFRRLRDEIVHLVQPRPDDVVVDVGAGTGLLTLALAPYVSKVWAIDISAAMLEYLETKAVGGELRNVETATANATSLPLADGCASVVVSNYCYHHLADADKERGVAEVFRVLRPGGRLVIGDMMFRVQLADERSRHVMASKIRSLLRRGPAGVLRLIKNALRLLFGRWEQPADANWWRHALQRAGFRDIEIRLLEHEGGLIIARRPIQAARKPRRWRARKHVGERPSVPASTPAPGVHGARRSEGH